MKTLTGLLYFLAGNLLMAGSIVSVNIAAALNNDDSIPDEGNIIPGETYGLIPDDNWNNILNSALTTWEKGNLVDDSDVDTGISLSLTGWDAKGYKGKNSGVDDTPFRFGVYSTATSAADGAVVTASFSGLDVYRSGYYLIAYIAGDPSGPATKLTVNDGTTTYYGRTSNPLEAALTRITDTSVPAQYAKGNYVVFGSESSPLTTSTMTISLQALAGNALAQGFGGFQIVEVDNGEIANAPLTVAISFDGGMTLAWNSRSELLYAVDYTTDFEFWSEITDSVEGQGETTTYPIPPIPSLDGVEKAFFRVRQLD